MHVAPAHQTLSYRRIEAARGPWLPALAAIAFGSLAIAGVHALLPRMPDAAIDVMRVGLDLRGMGGVLLLNDYLAVYCLAFFTGAAALLDVVLGPREQHRLELLLSKPIRPSQFVAARSWPVLAASATVGVATSAVCGLAIIPWLGGSESLTFTGTVGAGLLITALAIVALAVLNIVFIRIRDGFQALLVAFSAWFIPIIPTAVFLYRPDLFAGHTFLHDTTLLPNLIWARDAMAWMGPVALVSALGMAAGLVHLAGSLLSRTDNH